MTDNQRVNTELKEITCPSCGGTFGIDEPKCPFCGTMNPIGAEKEYMGKLHGIKDAVEDLPDEVQDDMEEGLKRNSKKMLRFLIIVIAIIVLIIGFVRFLGNKAADDRVTDYRAREEFRETYFDEFDRLYEEGKDDEMIALASELMDAPGSDALYRWPHFGYLDAYRLFTEVKEEESLYKETGDLLYLTVGVDAAIYLVYDKSDMFHDYEYSERDLEKMEGYKEYARNFLETNLNMTSEEVDEWVESIADEYGIVPFKDLEKSIKEMMKDR